MWVWSRGRAFRSLASTVVCVDKDAAKIARLQQGEMPIFEPGLEPLVAANVAAGRLSFTTDLAAAVDGAEAVFIAVGTPSRRGDGHADLSYVYAAAEEIGRRALHRLRGGRDQVDRAGRHRPTRSPRSSARRGPTAEFDVASNPEFLREGSAIDDFMRPDRVVIGADSERGARRCCASSTGRSILIETPIVFTDLETAELIKYAANAFLATKITFINEIADLCEKRRRRRPGRGARHRPRRPHRRQVPACRAGLWRLVLSQGHAGAGAHRARGRRAAARSSRP